MHCCCCLVMQSWPTLCNPMNCSTPGLPVLHHLSEFAQTHVHSVSDAIQSSHLLSPPFSSCLQSFPASGSFPKSWLIISRGQRYRTFSFSISPSNEYSGLISSRIDWLFSLQSRDSQESSPTPQFKSINASVLSFLYCPTLTSIHDTGKIIALTRRTFVGKVMSLLFNKCV